jgi:uncharacterized hydrophobic protein (TIGR00271 family)
MEYQKEALFIYDAAGAEWIDAVQGNPFGTRIRAIDAASFLQDPDSLCEHISHLVAAADMAVVEPLLQLCMRRQMSLGLLPLGGQRTLLRQFALPKRFEDTLEIALRDAAAPIDLVSCNGRMLLCKGVTGRIPLLESYDTGTGFIGFLARLRQSIRSFFTIRLRHMTLKTANEKEIDTALSGLVIQRSSSSGILSSLGSVDFSLRDGQVGAVLVSPFSVMEYLHFIASIVSLSKSGRQLPAAIGVVKSRSLSIESTRRQQVFIVDNTHTLPLPVKCELIVDALRINAPEAFWEANPKRDGSKESIKVANLPDARESQKYGDRHIPFFAYASEERFKELFSDLREDARINGIYITLMLLSTALATIGLFADSEAVVIGAMLLAPLMAPIVSLAMGLLRADTDMLRRSLLKIGLGMLLALSASALLALLLPHIDLTGQMKARTNPTLLDLGVAIVSGIAAAYSKSFKEIIQSLAGVSIAVALVPPLSTAGIGLGSGEWPVFSQAFLLFFTNLIGIALAATFTFQVLGYSSTVKSRKSILAILAIMLIISYPLYLSLHDIVSRQAIARELHYERFLIRDNYIIVQDAVLHHAQDRDVLDIRLFAREAMQREDLNVLKRKIEQALGHELQIEATVEYRL